MSTALTIAPVAESRLEQRAPVIVRGETGIERGVEAVIDRSKRVYERDRVVDLDPVPVDRELQVAEPARLEPRAHDDPGSEGIGRLRVEIRIATDLSSRSGLPEEIRQQLRRYALRDA